MAIFYNEGEQKIRPGVYQRHVNVGFNSLAGAQDGIAAIPIRAQWGPLGKVIKNTSKLQLTQNYGTGTYSTAYTVPAAEAIFDGGAATVYTYRVGTGGTAASKTLADNLRIAAKYPGTMPISISVQEKIGDSTIKQFAVYAQNAQVEVFDFAANGTTEGANLIAAAAGSKYVSITQSETVTTVPVTAVAAGALTGGQNPTVANANYSAAFGALEPYYYNTITLDIDDDENMTLSLLLQSYLDNAYKMGKLGIAVVGEKTTVAFASRLAHAKAFNDAKVVYLGEAGWQARPTKTASSRFARPQALSPPPRRTEESRTA